MREFVGNVAVVTGAGSGLGRALALECGRRGMRVVAADIAAEQAEETAGLLDGDSVGIECDVADAESVDELAEFTLRRFGRVDLLINNAGILTTGEVPESTLSTWRRTLDVNLMGVVHGVLAFVPRMRERG
ncbi:MAG: 3-phenylpropionate-dihydrodiol/cinnamic acid-dihydrodiol dehydrogenase, partial [Actinomycetota bacterium]